MAPSVFGGAGRQRLRACRRRRLHGSLGRALLPALVATGMTLSLAWIAAGFWIACAIPSPALSSLRTRVCGVGMVTFAIASMTTSVLAESLSARLGIATLRAYDPPRPGRGLLGWAVRSSRRRPSGGQPGRTAGMVRVRVRSKAARRVERAHHTSQVPEVRRS
jgi:hypothetical protein